MKKIIFIPHWGIGGGAGYYIKDLITVVRRFCLVSVAGQYANDYDINSNRELIYKKIGKLSLPNYEGVRFGINFYYFLLSIIRIVLILIVFRRDENKKNTDIIFLTSSIQSIAIPLIKYLFPGAKVFIVIQENVKLDNIHGWIIIQLLRQSDCIVSISRSWANSALKYNLKPLILRNFYSKNFVDISDFNITQSDLLYIGGGSRIKGYSIFIKLLPKLLKNGSKKIVCLGSYSTKQLLFLKSLQKKYNAFDNLHIVGNVSDIRPFLKGTKLLFLPITSAHFCRPAIEAGLFMKPFLITCLPDLQDFALNNVNCKMFSCNQLSSLDNIIFELLDDSFELNKMGNKGFVFSKKFCRLKCRSVIRLAKFICSSNG